MDVWRRAKIRQSNGRVDYRIGGAISENPAKIRRQHFTRIFCVNNIYLCLFYGYYWLIQNRYDSLNPCRFVRIYRFRSKPALNSHCYRHLCFDRITLLERVFVRVSPDTWFHVVQPSCSWLRMQITSCDTTKVTSSVCSVHRLYDSSVLSWQLTIHVYFIFTLDYLVDYASAD